MTIKNAILISACFGLLCTLPLVAQQKRQWVPGQFGLNAGVIPEPGVTYANLALNYSSTQLNDSNGNSVPGVNGTYSFWVDENITKKRGRLVASGIAGSQFASSRINSGDTSNAVTFEKSQMPTPASVAVEYFRTAK
jgi:hypothetical protein